MPNDIFQKMGNRFPNSVEKCGTIPLILLLPATPAPASIPNYGVQISPESPANTDCRYFLHGYDVKAGKYPPSILRAALFQRPSGKLREKESPQRLCHLLLQP